MEFEVTTNLALMQPQKIESNVAEVKAWLQNALEPYKSMVVSEDAIASAKADKANVNKLRKTLDDKRKAVKRQWVGPYIEWEKQVNELITLCDEAYGNINNQVASFENQLKDKKLNEIREYWNKATKEADVADYIALDKMFNQKWLNATVKIESVYEEIDKIIEGTVADIQTIADLESDYAPTLFLEYRDTHDIRAVLQKEKELKAIAASKASKMLQEQQKSSTTTQTQAPSEKSPQDVPAMPQQKAKTKYDLLMQLRLTLPQAKWLKQVLSDNGIEIVQSKMKEVTK